MLSLSNDDNKFRSDIIFEIKYVIRRFLAKGRPTIVDLLGTPLIVDFLAMADRIAQHGTFGNTHSHIDIPLPTREMFNGLENRSKTHLNLSNSSTHKSPRDHKSN